MDRAKSLMDLRSADRASFFDRLKEAIKMMADEEIEIKLPFLVLDHVAINEMNFKQLIFRIRKCASNGQQMENDGLNLFKVKTVQTIAREGEEAKGEWIIVLNCNEAEGNHSIYKCLN
jgi:hypothetical protein